CRRCTNNALSSEMGLGYTGLWWEGDKFCFVLAEVSRSALLRRKLRTGTQLDWPIARISRPESPNEHHQTLD
ncbi:MAG: hypothetical protein RL230_1577, partial [Pseudomonadota bacterium]